MLKIEVSCQCYKGERGIIVLGCTGSESTSFVFVFVKVCMLNNVLSVMRQDRVMHDAYKQLARPA
jgi:hypothetical protein